MPMAAIGAATGIGGSIASGIGGKKAQKAANQLGQQQLGLQKQQFGVAQQQLGSGNAALAPATNYWQSLLQGGTAARQAVGPYASLIGQAAQGARTSIQSGTARGGEQNLALAQNMNQQSNDISRLYAGMQPLAAQNLGQVGGEYLSSAGSFNPSANTGGAFANYANQQNNAQQAGQGFGSLLYGSLNKLGNKGSNTGPGSQSGLLDYN